MMQIRVLVIDDEPKYGELISDIAELLNIGCAYIDNAEYFEEALQQNPDIDLLFLDLNMPNRDGIQLLRTLAAQSFQGKIVIMSGFDEGVLSTAYDLAASHGLNLLPSLQKPFLLRDIKHILQNHVRQQSHDLTQSFLDDSIQTEMPLDEVVFALSNGHIELHYQPQICLSNNKVTGVEVLCRLLDGDRKPVYPNGFIDVIEANGLNELLLDCVITQLINDIHTHFNTADPFLYWSINVSALDLDNLDLPDTLANRFQQADISPDNIVIEITESSAIKHLHTGLDILARLRLKQFKLSIDDFGTGTAVLENIKRMPFTELKIDKTFIEKITSDKRSASLTADTIHMAQHLNMKVVAEGIEDAKTAKKLIEMGCDIAQGYYFAKPMPATKLIEYLDNNQELINKRIEECH
ncbi:EAL domain-containing protein [Thiomicrorhabdus sediminis]|uniref:EAL domain-containing protein n=1 Tax=Thiomicrorhabdus sediminis TaxID=2580412 RepID=A0A4V1HHN8_9GAMM|nr:EAL domain-containing response regulator [Thiomicrorhabdus sediminis]QCU89673.1 EAL domain-containing protein [Thiomicrorhabdus sediminis]